MSSLGAMMQPAQPTRCVGASSVRPPAHTSTRPHPPARPPSRLLRSPCPSTRTTPGHKCAHAFLHGSDFDPHSPPSALTSPLFSLVRWCTSPSRFSSSWRANCACRRRPRRLESLKANHEVKKFTWKVTYTRNRGGVQTARHRQRAHLRVDVLRRRSSAALGARVHAGEAPQRPHRAPRLAVRGGRPEGPAQDSAPLEDGTTLSSQRRSRRSCRPT